MASSDRFSAHAALSPWEGERRKCLRKTLATHCHFEQGKNALDAAVLAYTNISLLRQQLRPTHRVHGVFSGNPEWVPGS